MFTREKTRKIKVGNLTIGGSNIVLLQSMTNTKTKNIEATLTQINALKKEGCDLVRVAVLGIDDANALFDLVKLSPLPIVADIHFNYQFALIAAEANVAKIRINPGNIKIKEHIEAMVSKCKVKNIPIRIGINSGSLPLNLVKKYGWTSKCMIKSLEEQINILEAMDFKNIIYSLKSSNPLMAIEAYSKAAQKWDYPSHLGITEAGSLLNGTIKSSVGLGHLLLKGLGNTIRISLTEDPIEEIKVAKKLLNAIGLYDDIVEVIACPTCGRLEFKLAKIVKEIEDYVEELNFPLKIAILGCVVNGPGEASNADIGIAGGRNGGIIFKKGKIFKSLPQDQLVEELKMLIDEAFFNYKKQKQLL